MSQVNGRSGANVTLSRARAFCDAYELRVPILLAPMAGACPPALSIAVANGGGMGACGTVLMSPEAIHEWSADVRRQTNGAFQLNTWIPDPAPSRDLEHEAAVRRFLNDWGPAIDEQAADAPDRDFAAQCAAMLEAGPTVISSIMGVFPAEYVAKMKERSIKWFATVTTVSEAKEAVAAGADVVVAQGAEAGGHRGAFDAAKAQTNAIGLFSLLPAVRDAVDVPVVATGGIADGRGVAAALMLGASAVQIGTAYLRTPEAALPDAWAEAIRTSAPEDTALTRAFSGRLGRSIQTAYVKAENNPVSPEPAPYPIQRFLTQPMRTAAVKANDIDGMQAWAGQSAGMACALPAQTITEDLWLEAQSILS